RELCNRIIARMSALSALPGEELRRLPAETHEYERIDSRRVSFATYRSMQSKEAALVVVQGFLPSWRFPRYFGPLGVGFIVAEGLLVSDANQHVPATDDLLWDYR
ncbi:MAG: hypothetical protein KDA57_20955, partial [Planctomycetales bacterium]|nr:hypothetical protein [Planctomycetales bacterium]